MKRKKEPFPDVNVIRTFFVNEKHFSCYKCLVGLRKRVFFLLLVPPS